MMADMPRELLTADVFKRVNQASFRELLRAVAPDGSRPIIPAVRSERIGDVLRQVVAFGGAGNVVVPVSNGYMVLAIQFDGPDAELWQEGPPILDSNCTVGVLLARLLQDGDAGQELTYRVGDVETRATADLAGLAA